jgi:hypothetical protein
VDGLSITLTSHACGVSGYKGGLTVCTQQLMSDGKLLELGHVIPEECGHMCQIGIMVNWVLVPSAV